ncbi:PLP-dependent aminotransferase family protein [Leptospira fletcheri]|uniref:PLP-dependent aminotransferase family protein n=1 Tax=Leptospira fletcheri TaxID=2484981 RepID=A0A4R9GFJ8_9LEPT|nr:PLP-dependent aminotransferase family protein [Leptospira fletcheri]TGK11442.1 PLP-dependent aminotransferase family protein [Leptospira fletcheri]
MGKPFIQPAYVPPETDRVSLRVSRTPKSVVRDILKVIDSPEILSFAGGLPDDSLFPVHDFAESFAQATKEKGPKLFQYSDTQGHPELRAWIAETYYANVSPEQILITSGSQQALDLLARYFIDEGDRILIENPSYLGAIQSFSSYGPEFLGIEHSSLESNRDEWNKEWETKVRRKSPKFFYCIPDFQNPSGFSYPLSVRQDLADFFARHRIPIIEDVAYRDLYFTNSIPPSIHDFCPENTFSVGTFSKTLSPGLRVGWIKIPKRNIRDLVVQKQSMDLHSPTINQEIVFRFLESGKFGSHMENLKKQYFQKARYTCDRLSEVFGDEVRFREPKGGLFVWLEFSESLDSNSLFRYGLNEGVAVVPGESFYVSEPIAGKVRWNFSRATEQETKEGVRRLFRAWQLLNSDRKSSRETSEE